MFYEIRGTPDPAGVPVVLLHGAISATGTSFGPLPDLLAQTRQVITVEQQGHGRTADTGRPLPVQAMACDTVVMGRTTFLPALGAPSWPWPGLQVYVLTSHPLPAHTPQASSPPAAARPGSSSCGPAGPAATST